MWGNNRSKIIVLAASLLALGMTGCSAKLSKRPLAFAGDRVDPFELTPDELRTNEATLFYATARKPKGNEGPIAEYGNKPNNEVRLGTAVVQIGGKDATLEELEAKAKRGKRPTVKVTSAVEVGMLYSTVPTEGDDIAFGRTYAGSPADHPSRDAAKEYAALINERLAMSEDKDIYVYIHGATTDFTTPLEQFTTFAYYMGYDGVHMAYCWPVGKSFLGYARAERNAHFSARGFRELLEYLAAETEVEKIHVIAYSAGGALVFRTMKQMRLEHTSVPHDELIGITKIGNIIIAGTDEDTLQFSAFWLDGFDEVAENVTAYVSNYDMTVGFSWVANLGRASVSSTGSAPKQVEDISVQIRKNPRVSAIDATFAQTKAGRGTLGHSYWKDNPWVSTDVIMQLRYDLAPNERLLEPTDWSGWRFNNEYPDRLHDVIGELEGWDEVDHHETEEEAADEEAAAAESSP